MSRLPAWRFRAPFEDFAGKLTGSRAREEANDRIAMTAWGQGCVKTRLSQGRSELFSQSASAGSTYQCDGFRTDEIEIEILGAS
jgi:hypothetical protein